MPLQYMNELKKIRIPKLVMRISPNSIRIWDLRFLLFPSFIPSVKDLLILRKTPHSLKSFFTQGFGHGRSAALSGIHE